MVVFGQIVIGPPGSGKSTYCRAMHEFMTGLSIFCLLLYFGTCLIAYLGQYTYSGIGVNEWVMFGDVSFRLFKRVWGVGSLAIQHFRCIIQPKTRHSGVSWPYKRGQRLCIGGVSIPLDNIMAGCYLVTSELTLVLLCPLSRWTDHMGYGAVMCPDSFIDSSTT